MTMTDDLLVDELVARADRALPAMAVHPADVLSGGRRFRRRRTTRRWSIGTVVAGVAVLAAAGLGELGGEDAAPSATTEVVRRGDLTITILTAATALDTELGAVLDLGVPVDPEIADGPRYVVLDAGSSLELRTVGADGRIADERALTFSWSAAALRAGPVTAASGDAGSAVVLGALSWGAGPDIAVDGETVATMPTFETPDGSQRVFFAVVDGGGMPVEDWPTITVGDLVLPFSSQVDAEQYAFTVDNRLDAATLEVAVATAVREADSSAGPVLDLGVPVLGEPARETVDGIEALTYALLATDVGRVIGDPSLTPEEAGAEAITLAARQPFGALTPIAAAPLDPASLGDGPVVLASASDTDTTVLGRLPAGATGATLVVQRASGDERIDLPTFAVPGLAAGHAFFFFTLHDEVEAVGLAPVHIELVAADGAIAFWTVTGDLLYPQE